MSKMLDLKKYINVYTFEFELPGSGEVIKYKPITIGQMKSLMSYNTDKKYVIENALDSLISSSVESENFDIKELYLNDRLAILVELRKATKGSKYQFQYKCPSCKSQIMSEIDLNRLKIDKINKDRNPLITFDNTKISVELDYVKRKDQIEVTDFVYKKRKTNTDEEKDIDSAILTLASSIKKIILPDGNIIDEPTIEEKEMIINSLDEKEYQKFLDWFEKNKFGFDFRYKIKCNRCNDFDEEIVVPIEDFFL